MGRLDSRDATTVPPKSWARDDRILAAALCVALVFDYLAFGVHTYADADSGYDGNGILIGHDFIVFWTASALALDGNIADIFNAAAFDGWQRVMVGPPILPSVRQLRPRQRLSLLYPPTGPFPSCRSPRCPTSGPTRCGAWRLSLFCAGGFGSQWRSMSALALLTAPAVFACILAGQNGMLTTAWSPVYGFSTVARSSPAC